MIAVPISLIIMYWWISHQFWPTFPPHERDAWLFHNCQRNLAWSAYSWINNKKKHNMWEPAASVIQNNWSFSICNAILNSLSFFSATFLYRSCNCFSQLPYIILILLHGWLFPSPILNKERINKYINGMEIKILKILYKLCSINYSYIFTHEHIPPIIFNSYVFCLLM